MLEALEFNTASQWSIGKVLEIPRLIHAQSNLTLNDLNIAKKSMQRRKGLKPKKTLAKDQEFWCHTCSNWIECDAFYAGYSTICKKCYKERVLKCKDTLRGYLRCLVHSAKVNSSKKSSRDNDTRTECNITLVELFDILEFQNFRCYYSGIPMTFKTNADWRCSLERLDNMRGYTKYNCVLICWEFNPSHKTSMAKFTVHGSSQWSKAKFVYFYQTRFCSDLPEM